MTLTFHADEGTLALAVNDVDQGVLFTDIPPDVYPGVLFYSSSRFPVVNLLEVSSSSVQSAEVFCGPSSGAQCSDCLGFEVGGSADTAYQYAVAAAASASASASTKGGGRDDELVVGYVSLRQCLSRELMLAGAVTRATADARRAVEAKQHDDSDGTNSQTIVYLRSILGALATIDGKQTEAEVEESPFADTGSRVVDLINRIAVLPFPRPVASDGRSDQQPQPQPDIRSFSQLLEDTFRALDVDGDGFLSESDFFPEIIDSSGEEEAEETSNCVSIRQLFGGDSANNSDALGPPATERDSHQVQHHPPFPLPPPSSAASDTLGPLDIPKPVVVAVRRKITLLCAIP